ncbi:MAG: class I SAM-dependent methyltransferase [Steroidobacteraceae bacterium]
MTDWFDSALGRRVLQEETLLAREALEDVFGFDLLQIGHWGRERALLSAVRTQHATVVEEHARPGIDVRAQLEALPFSSDAIDAVLLPHTLEMVDDPYTVLREAARVLRPEGSLLICNFNPHSGWGVRRLLARRLGRPEFPPDIQRMISERRLKDWMALLGFDVERVFGYLSPVPFGAPRPAPAWHSRPAVMSGAYLLKARKRTLTLTLLRPRWRTRPRVLVPAAEPTNRVRG